MSVKRDGARHSNHAPARSVCDNVQGGGTLCLSVCARVRGCHSTSALLFHQRSARSTRTTMLFNQQIPPGILLGFPPLPRGSQGTYGHAALPHPHTMPTASTAAPLTPCPERIGLESVGVQRPRPSVTLCRAGWRTLLYAEVAWSGIIGLAPQRAALPRQHRSGTSGLSYTTTKIHPGLHGSSSLLASGCAAVSHRAAPARLRVRLCTPPRAPHLPCAPRSMLK